MGAAAKKYNTLYKKNHVERDMYLPRLDPKGVIHRSGCGAFHHRRHWTLTPPGEFSSQIHSHLVFCARILRNEEARAREKNPLERIMCMDAANGRWRVEATTEKLAQRLGRSLRRQGVESSVTSGGIIISSSVWSGKRAGPAGLNKGEHKDV